MNGYNFTQRVRNLLAVARDDAVRLGQERVAPEHILLGLIHERGGVATAVLENLGVDLDAVRQHVEEHLLRHSTATTTTDLPYTSAAKTLLERSMAEARTLGHSYVGTEHLLLGMLRDNESAATRILAAKGITIDNATAEVFRLLGPERPV